MISELEGHWVRCSGWLQDALDAAGNLFDLEDVKRAVDDNEAQFWPGLESGIVTEIRVYPNKKVLNVWLAGGKMAEIVEISKKYLYQFAKDNQCDLIMVQGRPGWSKIFKKPIRWATIMDEV